MWSLQREGCLHCTQTITHPQQLSRQLPPHRLPRPAFAGWSTHRSSQQTASTSGRVCSTPAQHFLSAQNQHSLLPSRSRRGRSSSSRGSRVKPCQSLMWDGSSGDMTLSEQLLSLREQDSLDDVGEGATATVNFHLQYRTTFGQGVKLIGSDPKLGNWDLRHALEMTYTPGDQWVASVDLSAGGVYEYKYVIINYETKEALEWQNGSNAVLAIIVDDTEVDVFDNWGNNPGAMVRINNESTTREGKLQRWAGYMGGFWKEAKRLKGELMQKNSENQGLRNELSQLRMELSLEQQNRADFMAQMKELKVENASLKNRLAQKTVELNRTLTEVLDMLDAGMLDEDDVMNVDGEAGLREEEPRSLGQDGYDAYGYSNYNSYGSSSMYGNDGSSNGYGSRQPSAAELLYGADTAAAEGQGFSSWRQQQQQTDEEQPPHSRPLVGWEAEAEAQAAALRAEGASAGGDGSTTSWDDDSSWGNHASSVSSGTPYSSWAQPSKPRVSQQGWDPRDPSPVESISSVDGEEQSPPSSRRAAVW